MEGALKGFTCALTLGLTAVAGASVAAQTVVRPDPSAATIKFAHDTLVQVIQLRASRLEVHAEVDSSGRASGRYLVRDVWPDAPTIIAADTESFAYDAPSVALVAEGNLTIVVLASYTGGMGQEAVTNYTLKILVLSDSMSRAYTLEDDDPDTAFFASDILSFGRTSPNAFAIHLKGGTTISYRQRQLTWTRTPSRS